MNINPNNVEILISAVANSILIPAWAKSHLPVVPMSVSRHSSIR